jgi:hypothetical protein
MQIRHGDLLIKSTEIPDGTKVRTNNAIRVKGGDAQIPGVKRKEWSN